MFRYVCAVAVLCLPIKATAQDSTVEGEANEVVSRPQTKNASRWANQIQRNLERRDYLDGIYGAVRVALDIDATGRATACQVTSSSGHELLDEATCEAVKLHARFKPARNAEGDRVPGRLHTIITTSP